MIYFARRHSVASLIPAFLLGIPVAAVAQTQHCDALHPLEGSPYRYSDRGNRCEGLYVPDVGARNIELVSLTRGPIRFGLQPGLNLRVLALTGFGTVHVRAVAKPARMSYRMDAVLEAGAALSWPVSDVLFPQSITATRIGVFGWKGNDDDRIYVPVQVTPSDNTRAASTDTAVLLAIRASFDATVVKWRSSALMNTICSPFGAWKDAVKDGADADQPVEISLAGLHGPSCVELAAQAVNGNEWATASIKIELPSK